MKTSVVIPCYNVKAFILDVIDSIGQDVSSIYVVDDKCPEGTGKYVVEKCKDARVQVIFHSENQGVGGAVLSGYKQAIRDGADIVVKLDGDGQMDGSLIPMLCMPIKLGNADYTKGNRFFEIEMLRAMPIVRVFGNSILSFVNKLVSGYWNIMDPTNGFTAIHIAALKKLPLGQIDKRYFFESDMLFRLGVLRAKVVDIAMESKYGQEESSLSIMGVMLEFPPKYTTRFFKRIFYNYFLRDFNIGSFNLLGSLFLFIIASAIGIPAWIVSVQNGDYASSGTVMFAALPALLGFQLLLAFLNFDVGNQPVQTLQSREGKC